MDREAGLTVQTRVAGGCGSRVWSGLVLCATQVMVLQVFCSGQENRKQRLNSIENYKQQANTQKSSFRDARELSALDRNYHP